VGGTDGSMIDVMARTRIPGVEAMNALADSPLARLDHVRRQERAAAAAEAQVALLGHLLEEQLATNRMLAWQNQALMELLQRRGGQ
jgi:hypothetical protein